MIDKSIAVELDVHRNHTPAEYRWTVAQFLATSWDGLLLLLLACWMLYAHLDGALMEPDESRYAEIPRLMLRTGDWITPKLQGKPYNDKPPLVYWLIAGSYAVFGVSIEAARFVPATAGLLTLCIVYLWSRRYLGRLVANAGILILLTMVGYVALMRMLLLDGVLTLLLAGSLLAGHHALAQGRHSAWWLISAILCGLGVLAKGPVAIVLVTPCLFALRWLDRSTTPMRFFDAVWYGLVVVALAVPWYAVMMMTNEGFGSEHFIRHHLQRFLEPAHHERPMWYYLPALFLELLPWPVLLFALLPRWRSWTGTERFLLFFCALCFVFFSIARAKLPTYLLPMLPILGVVLGKQLIITVSSLSSESRIRWSIMLTSLVILLAVTFRSIGFQWALHEGTPRIDLPALTALVTVIGVLLATFYWRNQSFGLLINRRWAVTILLAGLATYGITQRAIPDYAHLVSVVEPCQKLIEVAQQERIPYVAHRNSWDAISFVLNREEMEVFSSREVPAFEAWLKQHDRSMIWMREGDNRIAAFTKSLPVGIELERVLDLGRVQGIIVRQGGVVPAGLVQPR